MDQNTGLKSQENLEQLSTTPIAIIGMAGIFPGARNLSEYWDNILRKIDCVTDVPPSRWKIEDYYNPDPGVEDKTYCKRGGFIPDIDFDPAEFGLPPNILEVTDVSQLLGLVVARDALEDAGYGESRDFNRELTGVVLGVVGMSSKLFTPLMARLQYPIWEKALRSSGLSDDDTHKIIAKIKSAYVGWEENAFPGTIGNVVAGRIANRFDLGGTNCVVDAACASSLAAFRLAAAELIEGRADMMITGGVDTDNSINTYMCFSKTPAFSKNDHVRTFDAESDGMMVGEGIGMLVLKRLVDAERDHDRIYAVVKAVGTSSDGRFKSVYAPHPAGQAKALRRAYREAGFSPSTVGLIEAHGTGTMAGDPAEFQGIKEVFSENNPNRQTIALGSVKSQIAHTKATAGAASLIKTALALYHKVLPATINVTHPNPKFGIEDSPFYINTETRPWFRFPADIPRRAGVNSFGFGGTNFHVVLEEHEGEHQGNYRLSSVPDALLISAASPEMLISGGHDLLEKLKAENGDQVYSEWVIKSKTLILSQNDARLGFLSASKEKGIDLLQTSLTWLDTKHAETSWEHPEGILYRQSGLDPKGAVVALFPGQGSQYVDMGRELAVHFPPIREEFSQMDRLFINDGLEPLSKSVFPRPAFGQEEKDKQNEWLTRTENAQPAIGVLSTGMYKLFQVAGFIPDFVAGHSYGELTALWAAGVLNDRDYQVLAKTRGKVMAPLADPAFDAGTMLAVKGDADQISAEVNNCPGITLANWNSRHQVVLAGARGDIAGVEKALKGKGYSVMLLPVSAAFHTPLVGHAYKPFAQAIEAVVFNPPKSHLYSNTTGKEYPPQPDEIRKILTDHILNPVLFKDEIETIYAKGGRIFVEFGPKGVLTNLVDDILEGKPHVALAVNPNAKKDSDRQLREAALKLRVVGLHLAELDMYRAVSKTPVRRKKSSVTVTLNGGLYVSEKTRRGFNNALQDGFKVSRPGVNSAIEVMKEPVQTTAPLPQFNYELTNVLERAVNKFHENQSESLHLQETFLQSEVEYSRIFSEITQMEGTLISNALNGSGQMESLTTVLENLDHSMVRYHDHQNETLRVHEAYLKNQAETSQRYLDLMAQMLGNHKLQPSGTPKSVAEPVEKPLLRPVEPVTQKKNEPEHRFPSVEVPLPQRETLLPLLVAASEARSNGKGAAHAEINDDEISTALLAVVSEKTGYPVEMLEPGMDMEADLGIDSIKRVEILGAIQNRFPELPKIQPEVLAELRTLGQVRDQLGVKTVHTKTTETAEQALGNTLTAAALSGGEKKAAEGIQITKKSEVEEIANVFLKAVSEKTGYPPEMLELDMDMEADLGIDSIKRVEILGAVQQTFPELPKVKADELAEMHTLRQIINFLGNSSPEKVHESAVQSKAKVEELFGNIKMGMVIRKPLPMPDYIDFNLGDGMICLLTDEGTTTTLEVAHHLQASGMKVVVLSFPKEIIPLQSNFPADIERVVLDNLSEEHLQQKLSEIAKNYGDVAVFIHLDPIGKVNENEQPVLSSEKEILKTIFMLAKYLKEPLNRAAVNGRAVFMTAVHLDGEFGLGSQVFYEPVSGGLFGLVKTLNLEWEGVFCRALDLNPSIGEKETAKIIQAEIHDPNRLVTEIGYGPQGRLTLAVETIKH